jgi:Na+/proline symporter
MTIKKAISPFPMKFHLSIKHPFMQSSFFKVLGGATLMFIFAALLTSCASQNKIGCPMKIGKVTHTANSKDC